MVGIPRRRIELGRVGEDGREPVGIGPCRQRPDQPGGRQGLGPRQLLVERAGLGNDDEAAAQRDGVGHRGPPGARDDDIGRSQPRLDRVDVSEGDDVAVSPTPGGAGDGDPPAGWRRGRSPPSLVERRAAAPDDDERPALARSPVAAGPGVLVVTAERTGEAPPGVDRSVDRLERLVLRHPHRVGAAVGDAMGRVVAPAALAQGDGADPEQRHHRRHLGGDIHDGDRAATLRDQRREGGHPGSLRGRDGRVVPGSARAGPAVDGVGGERHDVTVEKSDRRPRPGPAATTTGTFTWRSTARARCRCP